MAAYLIKVSIIWLLILIVYQLFFNETGMYRTNRIFLLTGVLLGFVIPLIPAPVPVQPVEISRSISTFSDQMLEGVASANTDTEKVSSDYAVLDWNKILLIIYVMGIVVLLFRYIKEAIYIIRHAIFGTYIKAGAFKVFQSSYAHSPFSFMGWIFIGAQSNYTEQEMNFILRHEHAHNHQKHWLDILLIHIACIVVWFNPLIWIFRHKLKMQHEFEADIIAAGNNAYEYGNFLLQQTLLQGHKNLAHSFNYSPIKNRITMLTNQKNKQVWRYIAIVPVLCITTLLMAQDTSFSDGKKGNKSKSENTTTFEWDNGRDHTTVVYDPTSGEETIITVHESPTIVKMNNEVVVNSTELSEQKTASFRKGNLDFNEYFNEELKKHTIPDSIKEISINDVVIDKNGKIVHYTIKYACGRHSYTALYPLDSLIKTIIDKSSLWTPAIMDKKPVNVYISSIAWTESSEAKKQQELLRKVKEMTNEGK